MWTVMSAYNKVNGVALRRKCLPAHRHSEEGIRLQGIRRLRLGQHLLDRANRERGHGSGDARRPADEGVAGAARARTAAGNGGGWLAADKVLAEVKAGNITEATINDNVSRILRVIFSSGIFDHPAHGRRRSGYARAAAVGAAGRNRRHRAAEECRAVCCRSTPQKFIRSPSSDRMPLSRAPAEAAVRWCGPKYAIAPLDGIKKRAGNAIQVTLRARRRHGGRRSSARHSRSAREVDLKAATDAAAKADVAVVVVGRYNKLESEGFDVKTMDLPAGQDELIEAVEKANPHTIVVLNTGDPVTMTKWIDKTPALLDMWYGGQEGGHALACDPLRRCESLGQAACFAAEEDLKTRRPRKLSRRKSPRRLRRRNLCRLSLLRHEECGAAISVRLRAELYDVRVQRSESDPRLRTCARKRQMTVWNWSA